MSKKQSRIATSRKRAQLFWTSRIIFRRPLRNTWHCLQTTPGCIAMASFRSSESPRFENNGRLHARGKLPELKWHGPPTSLTVTAARKMETTFESGSGRNPAGKSRWIWLTRRKCLMRTCRGLPAIGKPFWEVCVWMNTGRISPADRCSA